MKTICMVSVLVLGCAGGTTTTASDKKIGDQPADAGSAGAGGASIDVPTPQDTPPRCGDEICNGAETCADCPIDCSECAKCDMAPTCTGAVAVPTADRIKPRSDLNLSDPEEPSDAGAPSETETQSETCGDPRLRIRAKQIITHEAGGISDPHVYCVINASDGSVSQITVTDPTMQMEDGDVFLWDPSIAIVWGGRPGAQNVGVVEDELRPSRTNLTITYNCFRSTNVAGAKTVADAVQKAALDAGGVGGPFGWAFGVGSVAAGLVGGAIQASSGDELLFNAQQTIDKRHLLDLTNGRTWSVRKRRDLTPVWNSWDWELTLEAWGCADARPQRPK